ncbi:MAG: sugar ABC transporter permease [Candidatus Latescibacterota bacterium]|nr:MAG: sugar ABC transporter permease [Candidatus Latescibacterota bacterium]RKY73885.1 MAG: sugar ABC transporter permease [Candidatus Latescibacterota bacterium]
MDKPQGPIRQIRQEWGSYLLCAPTLTLFLVFMVYPVLYLVRLSFYQWDGITQMRFIGLENYRRLLTDPIWWKALGNTLIYVLAKLLIELSLALGAAVALNTKLKGRTLFRSILFLPVVTSTAVMGIVFVGILSPFEGVFNLILMKLGLLSQFHDWLGDPNTALYTVIGVAIWHDLGINMVLFLAGLQSIPEYLYDAAKIDGAGSWQQFLHVTLPMLKPVALIIVMLSVIGSFKVFDIVNVMTNGGPYYASEVVTDYMFKYGFAGRGLGATVVAQQGYAATIGIGLFVIIAVFTFIQLKISKIER